MRTKIVLWAEKGQEEQREKILLALELQPELNKVKTWLFEGEAANEDLADQLITMWRKDEAVAFPENVNYSEAELSASGSILPEGVECSDKEDLIKRTHTEWLFAVLSTKLFKTYAGELSEIRDRIEAMTKYKKAAWDELKDFQQKMNTQVQEGNLFREHTYSLREDINLLFGQLKGLRETEERLFEAAAQEIFDKIAGPLVEIEEALLNNTGQWVKCFDRLKELQKEVKTAKLTRSGRNELWDRIDKAFKEVKDRRFGHKAIHHEGPADNRLQRRIDGLKAAIQKMEASVVKDEKELNFQENRINSGQVTQLETQLREVKSKMVKERLESKREKLVDMVRTLEELNSRLAHILAKNKNQGKTADNELHNEEEQVDAKESPAEEEIPTGEISDNAEDTSNDDNANTIEE